MDYSPFTDLLVMVFTDFGVQTLVILGAGVLLAGGVFLIRWGFRKAKGALDGTIEEYRYNRYGDDLEREAYKRGLQLNKRDNILQ